MKFTTTTALLLATGITTITAMPWNSNSKNPQHMAGKTPSSVYEEDITLRIEVVPKNQPNSKQQNPLFSAAAKGKSTKHDHGLASFLEDGDGDEKPEICLRMCAPQELKCPEGWHSKQHGDCWTCCKTIENDSVDL